MFSIELLDANGLASFRPDLVVLLINAVNNGASVNFVAPLEPEVAHRFWDRVENEVNSGTRAVLGAIEADSDRRTLVGCVHLSLAMQPNGLHRAEVQKLLVHSQHRQNGIGGALMAALESTARSLGRSLLVLDTEAGSPAERLYERCGYTRCGVIPRFALNSDGSMLIDTVVFYKHI